MAIKEYRRVLKACLKELEFLALNSEFESQVDTKVLYNARAVLDQYDDL